MRSVRSALAKSINSEVYCVRCRVRILGFIGFAFAGGRHVGRIYSASRIETVMSQRDPEDVHLEEMGALISWLYFGFRVQGLWFRV